MLLVVINDVIPNQNYHEMGWFCAAYVLNAGLEHLVDYHYHHLRLGGKLRTHLRTSIMNVNLQMDPRCGCTHVIELLPFLWGQMAREIPNGQGSRLVRRRGGNYYYPCVSQLFPRI